MPPPPPPTTVVQPPIWVIFPSGRGRVRGRQVGWFVSVHPLGPPSVARKPIFTRSPPCRHAWRRSALRDEFRDNTVFDVQIGDNRQLLSRVSGSPFCFALSESNQAISFLTTLSCCGHRISLHYRPPVSSSNRKNMLKNDNSIRHPPSSNALNVKGRR